MLLRENRNENVRGVDPSFQRTHGALHERPFLPRTRAGNDKRPLCGFDGISLLGVEFRARFRLGGFNLNAHFERLAVRP